MHSKQYTLLLCFSLAACGNGEISTIDFTTSNKPILFRTVAEIPVPAGFKRISFDSGSFSSYLLNIPLKKDKTVYLYSGEAKRNQRAQFAVIDISVGEQDLQQCADAVMRLRAEYLFSIYQFDKIVFYDNDNTAYRFTVPYTKTHLSNYLQQVFRKCGTASLSKQLTTKKLADIAPGDVLIRGGFPGHAVIVIDVAINVDGRKAYMLAQSYMPAQDIHILLNPSIQNSPWYFVNEEQQIITPEYIFRNNELKTW